jgi:hypothetical protein
VRDEAIETGLTREELVAKSFREILESRKL